MMTRIATVADTPELAETIAARFAARRTRPRRWIASCPAHDDRSPSLFIAAGRDGKVLVRCLVGCDLPAILQAVELHVRDLFPGRPPLSPTQQLAANEQRDRTQQARQAQRALEREAVEWLRLRRQELCTCLPTLSRQLAMLPDGAPGEEALTAHLHGVLNQIRWIDRVFEGEAE